MAQAKLKEDLRNYVITFDIRRLLTDLHDEYELTLDEINEIILEHVKKEEGRGTKFLKRFLVSGESKDTKDEVFTIAEGKTELDGWLKQLKDAQWSLYSLEVAGGAKSPAEIVNPVKRCTIELQNVETREFKNKIISAANNKAAPVAKKPAPPPVADVKPASKQAMKPKAEQQPTTSSKANVEAKKTSPKDADKKKSPEEQKSGKQQTKTASKKGINDFFGPKRNESKPTTTKAPSVIKPPTPKKIDNFFKKQAPAAVTANRSMQLFDDDDNDSECEPKSKKSKSATPEKVEIESSDDEEQLRAIRLDIGSDSDAEKDGKSSMSKRRRIVDSDEEEEDQEPQSKHEKKEAEAEEKESKSDNEEAEDQEKPDLETYLDEDGFVVTVKTKPNNKKPEKKPSKSAAPSKKSSPKAASTTASSSKDAKAAATPNTKTKQGSITSFFKRK